MDARAKLLQLSPELRRRICPGERIYTPDPSAPVSDWLVRTKRHCNGGRTIDAGLWLKEHCDRGGKIFIAMSGAGSSFELGVLLGELIRAGKIAAISVTGANLEESLYRLVAHSHYAHIPEYQKLTRPQEVELERAGYRRITDTFLPEEESVRIVFPKLETLWREAEASGERHLWHEYFFKLFEREILPFDGDSADCWLYQAWRHSIPVFVPGAEDSTMGNIFTWACYGGNHPLLTHCKLSGGPIDASVVLPSWSYMHRLAEWYVNETEHTPLAFLQLGGGIAGDFPICVVPHLKKDFFGDQAPAVQEQLVQPWAGFIEIHSSPMSFGSYSGAGFDEKITWGKVDPDSFGMQIFGDYTTIFPDIAALVLGR